jgi:glycosyltransferase involved in cell wall biosynthesis
MEASGARLLCIVVPCFDEAEVLSCTYAELKRVLAGLAGYRHLIYFVDDGSRDGTLAELNRLARHDESVRVLSLSRNFGHQVAIIAGLEHAERRADALLVMDADLENPPALIPQMLAELERGHDVVLGVRETGRRVGVGRRLGSRAFYWLFNQLADVPITPGAPDFFLLSPRAREALEGMAETRPFLRAMVAWIGFPAARVPYVPPARAQGRSKYTLSRMLRLAEDALFAFSSAPARLLLRAGGAAVLLGLLLLSFVAWPGVAAGSGLQALIAGLALSASGVQLVGLGVIAGYLVRALEDGRARPRYVLKQVPEEQRLGEGRLVGIVGRDTQQDVAQRKRASH